MSQGQTEIKVRVCQALRTLVLLAVILGVAALLDPYFFTEPILVLVLQDTALLGILTMAEALVLVCGGIDLSIPNLGLLCASMTYYLVETGTASAPAAAALGVACAAVFGVLNGLVVTRAKLHPVVVTLSTAVLARGICGACTNNIALFDTCEEYGVLSQTPIWVIPTPLLIMLGTMVICALVFQFTIAGRQVFAVGGSERSAELSGLRVGRIKTFAYGAAGLLAGIAGLAVLANAQLSARFYNYGPELEILLAALLGGVSLRSGPGVFRRACLGAGLMAVINRLIYTVSIFNYSRAIGVSLLALLIIGVWGGIYRRE